MKVHRLLCPHEQQLFSLVMFRGTPHINVGDLGNAVPRFCPPRDQIRRFLRIGGQCYVSARIATSWVKDWEPENRRRLERITEWAATALREVETSGRKAV